MNKEYNLNFLTDQEIEIISRHKKITKKFASTLNHIESKRLAQYIYQNINLIKFGKKKLIKKTFKKSFVNLLFPSIYRNNLKNKSFNKLIKKNKKIYEPNPRKICLFTAHLGPGGAERQISILAKLLKNKGYEVIVIVMNSDESLNHYTEYIKSNGIKVEVLDTSDFEKDILFMVQNDINPNSLNCLPLNYRKFAANLITKIIQEKINILHCYLDIPNIVGGVSGLISNVPNIRLSFRNTNPSHFPETYNENFKPFYKLILKYKNRIQLEANNKFGANDYANWLKISNKKIKVIYNGIEINQWKIKQDKIKLRKKLGLPLNKFIIISVCRLSTEKRPFDIIKIAKTINQKNNNFLIIHVGIGNLEKEFRNEIKKHNLEKDILSLGERNDIKDLLSASDLFLLTSEQEGFPNSIMEAMIVGIPIIATKVGGVPELVENNKNGFVYKVGEIEKMSESIFSIYRNKKIQRQIKINNQEKILNQFNQNIFIEKILNEYQKQKKITSKNKFSINTLKILTSFLYFLAKPNKTKIIIKSKVYRIFMDNFSETIVGKKIIKKNLIKSFYEITGKNLGINNPKTFSEKMQWLKLNNRDKLMTICADKYMVKDYVANIIGEKYIIPNLKIWKTADEIDFSQLPDKFVLKTNWGSGQNIIVSDKKIANESEIKEKFKEWLKPENNHYYQNLEWSYKNIQPKIIAEKYICEKDKSPEDYKFFCFGGEPKFIQLDIDRFGEHKRNLYDINWNLKKIRLNFKNGFDIKREIPKKFEEMKILAKKLSKNFLFVRVDFYNVNGKIYFGELTFYPGNGTEKFTPEKWDYKFGSYLNLPIKK